MAELNSKEEKNAVDYITNCMFSVDFLKTYTDNVFDNKNNKISIFDFYQKWLKSSKVTEYKMPFSPGAFLGLLFVGILYAKENWFNLIPNIELEKANEWGVNKVNPVNPKDPEIKLRNFARRLRNSLGHGYAKIIIPDDGATKENIMDKVSFEFKDKNMRDETDTFQVEITMSDLITFIRKFQSEIHNSVKIKM